MDGITSFLKKGHIFSTRRRIITIYLFVFISCISCTPTHSVNVPQSFTYFVSRVRGQSFQVAEKRAIIILNPTSGIDLILQVYRAEDAFYFQLNTYLSQGNKEYTEQVLRRKATEREIRFFASLQTKFYDISQKTSRCTDANGYGILFYNHSVSKESFLEDQCSIQLAELDKAVMLIVQGMQEGHGRGQEASEWVREGQYRDNVGISAVG